MGQHFYNSSTWGNTLTAVGFHLLYICIVTLWNGKAMFVGVTVGVEIK